MKWFVSEFGLQKCIAHVESSVAHFDRHRTPFSRGYNHNTITGSLVGVKCEVALSELLSWSLPTNCSVQENFWTFSGKRGHGDIDVVTNDATHVIEVKGLQEKHWDRYQRCVTPHSLNGYVKRNSIVVWGTTNGEKEDALVHLRGWNWAHEIQNCGKYVRTICDNMQLSKDFPLHSMLSLVHHIRGDRDEQ